MLTSSSTPEEARAEADQTEQVIDTAIVATTAATAGLVAALRVLWVAFLGTAQAMGPVAQLPSSQPYRQLLTRYARAVQRVQPEFPGLVDTLARARRQGHQRGGGMQVRQIPDPQLEDALPALHDRTRDRLDQTATQLLTITPAPATAAAAVRRIGSQAQASAAWQAARAVNRGVEEAIPPSARSLWVGERNACVRCTAYIGAVSAPTGMFAPLLIGVLDANDTALAGTARPALHPHCRCSVEAYDGPPAGRADSGRTDLATALAREAQRSIARGLSDHDSTPARLRALDGLLLQGTQLPASVVKTAVQSLERGRFPARPR